MSKQETYRKNVAIVVINDEGKILVCHRCDEKSKWRNISSPWQLPQGGVDKGETIRAAMLRELQEEIGTNDVDYLDSLEEPIRYDWPEELHHRGYLGQEQYYFLVKIRDESAIDLEADDHQEFDDFEWLPFDEFKTRIYGFKYEAYCKAITAFIERNPGQIV